MNFLIMRSTELSLITNYIYCPLKYSHFQLSISLFSPLVYIELNVWYKKFLTKIEP